MRRRKTIALLSNDAGFGRNYQGLLRRGVEQACEDEDLDLWCYTGLIDWSRSALAQLRVLELVDARSVDGVVIAAACLAPYTPSDELVRRLARSVPVCSVGQTSEHAVTLLTDNTGGTARLIEHFVDVHDKRRVLYIAGPDGHQESGQRLSAVQAALARYQVCLPRSSIYHGNFSVDSARQAVRDALASRVEFDCVIAANDDMAFGAINELNAHGLRCPTDVAVGGFDDAPSARLGKPQITTVRQPVALLGAAAVARILDAWHGREMPRTERLDTALVIRESCGCSSLDRRSGHQASGVASRSSVLRRARLDDLLAPVLDSQKKREYWSAELVAAVSAEQNGADGVLSAAFERLLGSLTQPGLPFDELQQVITALRHWASESGPIEHLEESFHAARMLVGTHASILSGDREFRTNWLLLELQVNSEKLATSLSLAVLRETLTVQFPKLGIRNALVSLYTPGGLEQLECLVCIEDGVPVEPPAAAYPASLVIPEGVLELAQRASFTVLSLTFEAEHLGVLVFELPLRLPFYLLLREQIGGAIKTVRLHQDMLEQARLNAQVQEEKRVTAERLKSLSLVAGGVAHDLNNVLGPLLALPETIHRELETGAATSEVFEDLETIQEAGQRAAHTIRDLLTLGRASEIPREPLDLNAALEGERSAFDTICDKESQIAIELVTSARPVIVRASRPHVVRAVSNLVLNAVDAIDGSGTIKIRVVERVLTRRLEGIEPVDPGDYGVIEVEDNGAGIPPLHLPHVLDPFFTAKRRPGIIGTGLGLAIVHRIVKESQGSVHVESEPGRGTTFSLYFPRQPGAAQVRSVEIAGAPGGTERILVIDDEVVQLRTARRVLAQLGYSVATAISGREAIELVTYEPKGFDLLIVDLQMPGQDGLATVERARQLWPAQRVLVASGYAPDEMNALAKVRDLAFIPKPYTRTALAAAVRLVLDTRARTLADRPEATGT